MSAINISNLSKCFGEVHALNGVSFEVAQGDFFGLLGPNGAGKTTLMRVLCGLLSADTGEVAVFNRKLERWKTPPEIGVVPQDIALYDMLSAKGNLELFGKLRGLSGRELESRISRALELTGLSERASSKVKTFSGGMKRRLNLAVALLHEPKILLLDEPTVGVDPQSRASIFTLLEDLHSRGTTILYTTHYMEEAERLCRNIAILDHGKLLGLGSLEQLLKLVRTPRFVRALLRSDSDEALKLEGLEMRKQGLQVDYIPRGESDLMTALGKLAGEPRVQRVEIVSPNLEQLFLELTGRELRDQ
jgi:ABC-2 type transport system ATP-binding protein